MPLSWLRPTYMHTKRLKCVYCFYGLCSSGWKELEDEWVNTVGNVSIVMCWSYSSLSYVLLQGFFLYMHHFPCCAGTLRDSASPATADDENGLALLPLDEVVFLVTQMNFDRNISSILQYVFFLGLYSISSILMLNLEFLPWVTDVSPSSTLHQKPNLNIKRSILFVFVRSWYVL